MCAIDPEEFRLLTSRWMYPLVHQLIKKLYDFLAEFRDELSDWIYKNELFDDRVDRYSGKISRGWNHKRYPYVLLDFPRYIKGKRFWWLRTLCWFGNHWSVSLVASQGTYVSDLASKLEYLGDKSFREKVYIIWGPDIWDNDPANWYRLNEIEIEVTSDFRLGIFLPIELSFSKLKQELTGSAKIILEWWGRYGWQRYAD